MSTRTAPQHTAAELVFLSADTTTGIVEFAAASKSRPGEANIVSLDTTNGALHCTCKGAECGQACWHADHVLAAWLASPAMQQVRWLSDESLVRHGKKARSMVTIYAARIGRTLPADALSLVAAGGRRPHHPTPFPVRRRAVARRLIGFGWATCPPEKAQRSKRHLADPSVGPPPTAPCWRYVVKAGK